jgi:hypothetical protein
MKNPHVQAGRIVLAEKPQYVSDKILKIISFCVGMAVLILFLVRDLLNYFQDEHRE